MTIGERLTAIRASGCFAGWSGAAVAALLPHFDEVAVRSGERLAVEGAPCHQFVVVGRGRLETCARGRAATLGPGDSFGWSAMEQRGPCEATVVALTPAQLLVMSHAQFRAARGPSRLGRFARWALPSSRRSLPRRPTPAMSVEPKKPGANPAC